MPINRLVPIVLLLIMFSVGLSGCSSANTVTIATDAVFPPFHSVDESGSLVGFDIELARTAAERAGLHPRFVRAPAYAELFTGLVTGEYDIVAATTGITPERLKKYGFTRPYFVTCLAVLARDEPGPPTSPADLAGVSIAASRGTTSARAAHQIPGATVLEMSRAAESLAALRSGEADAMIVDEFEAVPWAAEADDLRVLPEAAATESYGLVVRQQDDALRERLNAAIRSMEADGTLAALRARFGLDRPDSWPVHMPDSID